MSDAALDTSAGYWRDDQFVAQLNTLATLTADYGRRGWIPATSSNFSFRLGPHHCAVTRSGGDKSRLRDQDMLVTTCDGRIVDAATDACASAEAALHHALYRRDPAIGAVLHTHTPNAVLATRLCDGAALQLADYEMLKAFANLNTHATRLTVPVIPNDQNMQRLAASADAALDTCEDTWAYLIEGHGAYVWGADLETADRHLQALDYLLGIELELARINPTHSTLTRRNLP